MRISVVIPAYNESKYIQRCIESILKQSYPAYEIIVVDNNSTDSTRDILCGFPQVKVVSEKKQGMIFARNTGFNCAHGEIIARCDADTICPPDWLEKIKGNFENTSPDAICGTTAFYDYWFGNKNTIFTDTYLYFAKMLYNHHVMVGPNMSLTKNIWNKIKDEVCLDDKEVHEDIDMSMHISKYGKIVFDKDLVTYISARRLKYNPLSFFIEYPIRLFKTKNYHKKI